MMPDPQPSPCLTPEQIEQFARGDVSREELAGVQAHIDGCTSCHKRVMSVRAGEAFHPSQGDIPDALVDELRAVEITADAADPDMPGALPTFPGYKLTRELDRGGQGVVYEAIQESTKAKVALKVLLSGVHASASAQKRFEREIEIIAQLRHPYVVSIHDAGKTDDGCYYYAMEYVRGMPLQRYVRERDLTVEQTLQLFVKVCAAVQHAHHHGVIHRDLKPTNILVGSDGNPKVLDFGLAKQLAAPADSLLSIGGAHLGTLPYMSPEQTRSEREDVDSRTDIYSLSVILYELLTGSYPYQVVGDLAEVLQNIAKAAPTPLTRSWKSGSGVSGRSRSRSRDGACPIDDELQTIVFRALAKEPERRYQTVRELALDVGRYLDGKPIEAKSDSGWYVFRKTVQRYRTAAAVAFGFIASLVVFLVIVSTLWHSERKANAGLRAEALVSSGMAHHYNGKSKSAYNDFREAARVDPTNHRGWGNAARMLKDMFEVSPYAETNIGDLTKAEELCGRALALRPDLKQIWNLRAGILYLFPGRAHEAEAAARRALDLDAEYHLALATLAKSLALQGELTNALEAAKRGAKSVPPVTTTLNHLDTAWLTLGTIQLHLGEDEAFESIGNALKIDRRDSRNLLLAARLHLTLPGHIAPEEALKRAAAAHQIKVQPDPMFDRILAQACLATSRLEDAVEHAKAALKAGDEPAYTHLIRAIAEARLGHAEAAREQIEKADNAWPQAFHDGHTFIVHAKRSLLWFDTLKELSELRDRAIQSIEK